MERLNLTTSDIATKNIEKLGLLFPNCLTEKSIDGKTFKAIDFDILRQEVANFMVEGPEQRYQFTWPDKRAAIRLANTPTSKTLRPCRAESVDFDTTQNLYIEGDNLDVLKLLRENYLGKVKMIYIDPPTTRATISSITTTLPRAKRILSSAAACSMRRATKPSTRCSAISRPTGVSIPIGSI